MTDEDQKHPETRAKEKSLWDWRELFARVYIINFVGVRLSFGVDSADETVA